MRLVMRDPPRESSGHEGTLFILLTFTTQKSHFTLASKEVKRGQEHCGEKLFWKKIPPRGDQGVETGSVF